MTECERTIIIAVAGDQKELSVFVTACIPGVNQPVVAMAGRRAHLHDSILAESQLLWPDHVPVNEIGLDRPGLGGASDIAEEGYLAAIGAETWAVGRSDIQVSVNGTRHRNEIKDVRSASLAK
jgi:phosphoribosylcarboxyaminoimidazole (NCAIR) mutase